MPRRILIIDDHDDLATALTEEFSRSGHVVKNVGDRDEALRIAENEVFDLVITDLDGEHFLSPASVNGSEEPQIRPGSDPDEAVRSNIKAFKINFSNFKIGDLDESELIELLKTTLNHKTQFIDKRHLIQQWHEKIDFEVPSLIALMDDILEYLMKRVQKLGVVTPERSNLFVALDEAFVNAVKHGNKFDATKLVRISVYISPEQATFTIEDEGEGFNVEEIPDPRDPENLFKASGRGVMFIHNIMDEVTYNKRGNRLTMVKRTEKSDI